MWIICLPSNIKSACKSNILSSISFDRSFFRAVVQDKKNTAQRMKGLAQSHPCCSILPFSAETTPAGACIEEVSSKHLVILTSSTHLSSKGFGLSFVG